MDTIPIQPQRPPEREDKRRRWGLWRGVKFVLGGPISAVPTREIVQNAGVIKELVGRIRTGPGGDSRVWIDDGRFLDLKMMAAAQGVNVATIRWQLANRRRQTARLFICYLFGAIGFFVMWLIEAITTPAYTSFFIGLLAICAAFLLSAFYNALVNWQIRNLRLGSALEFLHTEQSWWPS